MDDYKRTVVFSRESDLVPVGLEYIARFSAPIELESGPISELVGMCPFQPFVKMLQFVEEGEYYERSQHPDYDVDCSCLLRERSIILSINIDPSYIDVDTKLYDELEYLLDLFNQRKTSDDEDVALAVYRYAFMEVLT